MKKASILVLAALLIVFSGCGKKPADPNAEVSSPSQTQAQSETSATNAENAEASKAEAPKAEKKEEAEAPVIQSAEELQEIANEFNTTEDPERKEELRKQLEAFLATAQAQGEASTNANE